MKKGRKEQISLFDYCKKINRSNGAHKRLLNKAAKKAINGQSVRYHRAIIRIQNAQCRLLTKKEKESIFNRI